MNAVLDAGALIAIDRRDRQVGAMLRVLQRQATPLRSSAAVVGQVWRDGARQANLARTLQGVGVADLTDADGRRVGELLSATRSADVVDAHVCLLVEPGGCVMTSDPGEMTMLLSTRGIAARVVRV